MGLPEEKPNQIARDFANKQYSEARKKDRVIYSDQATFPLSSFTNKKNKKGRENKNQCVNKFLISRQHEQSECSVQ